MEMKKIKKALMQGRVRLTTHGIQSMNKRGYTNDGEIIKEVEITKNEGKMVFQGSNYGFVELVDGQKYYWPSSANKENGKGDGNPLPIHVAIPSEQLRTWKTGELHLAHAVWITKGALKADVVAEHIPKVYDPEELVAVGSTVLAVPGVNTGER